MTITLTPELQSFVELKVSSGQYDSEGEVVSKALELLDANERMKETRLADLRAEIHKAEEQYDRGEFIEIKSEADAAALRERIKRRGRDRLAQRRLSK